MCSLADASGRLLVAIGFLTTAAIGATLILSVVLSVIWFIRWLP